MRENRRARGHRLPDADALALHTEYRETGDPRLRDRLVIAYAGVVKHILYRKVRELPAWCEVDDLLSCGVEALISAVDRFDPERGATFEQYAWTPVHCAAGSATSRRRASSSARSTTGRRTPMSSPTPWGSTASSSTACCRTSR